MCRNLGSNTSSTRYIHNAIFNKATTMIKAVIFDLDGTLIDTEQLGYNIFKQAALLLDLHLPDSVYFSMIGLTKRDSAKLLRTSIPDISDEKLDLLGVTYDDLYAKSIHSSVPLRPGAIEALEFVQKSNLRCSLATSSSRRLMKHKVTTTDIEKYFDHICTGDEVTNGKPSPEIFEKAVNCLGLDPSHCLVVEDSEAGVISATRAGLATVLVQGIAPIHTDVKSLAFMHLSSLHELPQLITDYNISYHQRTLMAVAQ